MDIVKIYGVHWALSGNAESGAGASPHRAVRATFPRGEKPPPSGHLLPFSPERVTEGPMRRQCPTAVESQTEPDPREIHEGRTQRSLSVWQRQEVQEVLPCQGPGGVVEANGCDSASAFVRCITSPGSLPDAAASEACRANRPGTRRESSNTSPAAGSRHRESREPLAGVRVSERRGPDCRLPQDPGRRRGDGRTTWPSRCSASSTPTP